MIQSVGFKFPYDQSDQWDGFNDSGIEHFSGNPYVHLALLSLLAAGIGVSTAKKRKKRESSQGRSAEKPA